MVNVQVASTTTNTDKEANDACFQCSISTVWSVNNIVMLDTIKPWRFPCTPTSCCGRGISVRSWFRNSRWGLRIFVTIKSSTSFLTFSARRWHFRCTTIIRFLKDRIFSMFTNECGIFSMFTDECGFLDCQLNGLDTVTRYSHYDQWRKVRNLCPRAPSPIYRRV